MAKSPKKKRNMNPKSLENLKQNTSVRVERKVDKIQKEILSEVEVDEHLLSVLIPEDKNFKGKEKETFMIQFKYHLLEFAKKGDEPTVDDIEDIAELCMNNILIQRFMRGAGDDIEMLEQVMPSIEKLKKNTANLKNQLASTRSMRIDPRAKSSITILDLLEHVERREAERLDKINRARQEEKQVTGYSTSVDDMIK